ncbi:MAG: hypothetical protein A2X01_11825 [Bacteroidetes bacterium GWF2_35_48]|nr:MAG: hypothetical protein A2X01_11825 [Bacteroidetes bacterium GWF2_35_48]
MNGTRKNSKLWDLGHPTCEVLSVGSCERSLQDCRNFVPYTNNAENTEHKIFHHNFVKLNFKLTLTS